MNQAKILYNFMNLCLFRIGIWNGSWEASHWILPFQKKNLHFQYQMYFIHLSTTNNFLKLRVLSIDLC